MSLFQTYTKRPIETKGCQLTAENAKAVFNHIKESGTGARLVEPMNKDPYIMIKTLEGEMRADTGTYIMQGVKDEFWAVQPDIFEETYDIVESVSEADAVLTDLPPEDETKEADDE